MAEAIGEEQSQIPSRFYCHMCNVEVSIPNSDYTCPLCAGGFIEELPANAPPAGSNSNLSVSSGSSTSEVSNLDRLNDLDTIRGEIATLLMSRNGPNVEISLDPENRRGNVLTFGSGRGNSTGSNTAGGRVRHQTYDRLDNVLMDFLQSLSGDGDTPFGNSQMFFMGNPGDYAWGREGIDTIVTQLLNQMETSGPPPLAKDKIQEIPKVDVKQDEVDKKLQCSVCWEDFRLQEIVRKLPCSHIYHEGCIVPWLDLHGTCPICRKSLAVDEDLNADVNMENSLDYPTHSSNNVNRRPSVHIRRSNSAASNNADVINNATTGNTASRTTRSSTATSSIDARAASTPVQQNNVFSFDDGNVDLD